MHLFAPAFHYLSWSLRIFELGISYYVQQVVKWSKIIFTDNRSQEEGTLHMIERQKFFKSARVAATCNAQHFHWFTTCYLKSWSCPHVCWYTDLVCWSFVLRKAGLISSQGQLTCSYIEGKQIIHNLRSCIQAVKKPRLFQVDRSSVAVAIQNLSM